MSTREEVAKTVLWLGTHEFICADFKRIDETKHEEYISIFLERIEVGCEIIELLGHNAESLRLELARVKRRLDAAKVT